MRILVMPGAKKLVKMSKYRNQPTQRGEVRFHSKKEAKYNDALVLRQKASDIQGFLRQMPIRLPGGVVYWCDFLVCEKDGSLRWIDVKGVRTQVYANKKKIVEALYPWIKIEER